ncbi:MAG: polyprenyl synthetase family protein [Planctomycetota bacterium]|nr:MAG: polyprenyl synthetase family protein [Planctomycetota bacterium]
MSAARITDTAFDNQLRQKAQLVNSTLQRLLTQQTEIDNNLKKAIEYTLQGKGKRIRAAVLLWCCELVSGKINHGAEVAAAAIEMVHTYSLVHDDLPAMDDDDLRRGLPTCHKAFDEATAILTGDALLTLAFEVLANRVIEPAIAVRLISQLAMAAGAAGMIAGQAADLRAENGQGTQELLEYIHTNKTAKIFRCAAAMGAICGQATEAELECLCEYGLKIGLAFQIADDILDVSASADHLGKTAGKDARAAKCTYPSVLGLEKSRQLQQKLTNEAVKLLELFGGKAQALQNLATALLQRTR